MLAILRTIASIAASRTQNLPGYISEARYVFLAAIFISGICLAGIPIYFITTWINEQIIVSPTILSHCSIALTCLLLPTMYIIYFRPKLNTHWYTFTCVTNFTFNSTQTKASSVSTKLNRNHVTKLPIASC